MAAFAAVSLATAVIGFYGLRISRTTGDFYVASRTVRPWWNASAIGGEYLSAASFLGVAGLILLSGTDALWFPVGYTAGYLMLLLVRRRSAAPVRAPTRSLTSPRRASIPVPSAASPAWWWSWSAGSTSSRSSTAPPWPSGSPPGCRPWVGSVAVVGVVCITVVAGGMRSITFVQAFQYWLKLTALAVPVVFIAVRAGRQRESAAVAAAQP